MKSSFSIAFSTLLVAGAQLLVPANAVCPVTREDSDIVAAVLESGELVAHNILVTFGELADIAYPPANPPHPPGSYYHRGVTYTPLDGALSLVIGGTHDDLPLSSLFGPGAECLFSRTPITRNVNTPLMATIRFGDTNFPPDLSRPVDPWVPIGLILDFDDPTPIFGFGYGYNDLDRSNDGTRDRGVDGWVTLYDEDDHVIGLYPLRATRLYCCTEGSFDYLRGRSSKGKRPLIGKAKIEITTNYIPFAPGVSPPREGPAKFLGLDWVRYQVPYEGAEN